MKTPSVQTSDKPRKGYRLFKRHPDGRELPPSDPTWREQPYYFRFSFRGKRYLRCLEVPEQERAQKYARVLAKEICDALMHADHQRLADTRIRNTPAGTISQLLDAYELSPVDAEASTRRQNALALRQLLRCSTLNPQSPIPNPSAPMPADPAGPEISLPVTAIDGTVVRRWFERASERARLTDDQAAKASIKRTANSRYVQAKSVLAPKAMAAYKDKGLYCDSFETFLTAGATFRFAKLPASSFNPPSDTIIKNTLEAWQQIEDRDLFLASGFELSFGLRLEEMANAQWSWLTTREGYPVLDGCTDVKNGTGLVQVRALDPWYATLRARITAKNWQAGPADYIITGTPTNRRDGVPRAVSHWLRNLGWQTQKTNHELRKYAGSQVAMRYGIYDAQCWLRHSTVKVTEQHYSGYVRKFKPTDPDSITARWATVASGATPQIRLLEAGA